MAQSSCPFIMQSVWFLHREFEPLVHEHWENNKFDSVGSMEGFKKTVDLWNVEKFGNIF